MEIEPALPCVVDTEQDGRLDESVVPALLVPVLIDEADHGRVEAT